MSKIKNIKKSIIVILIIVVGYFIFVNLPLGTTNYKSSNSKRILEIPYLSIIDDECCMFGISFKNIRSVTSLKSEIKKVLNQYETVSYNGKICYYNEKQDFTITEYGVERSFLFNKVYFVYDTGRFSN